jgi:DNA-binding response OmpR family regulator
LSERGNWELRVRRDQETTWRLACTGDLACGIVTAQPVAVAQEEVINVGPLMVDPAGRRVTVKGKELCLARKEFALLLVLAAQPDRVFSKEELLATVWGHTGKAATRTLDGHASRLRNKLKRAGAPGLVINEWSIGYRLRERPDLAALPPLGPTDQAA